MATIGSGKTGTEVRKTLRASPFGWPQDAVDAALIALHRSQYITATLNNAPVPLGRLDQNRIAKALFRVEQTTLSIQDRLLLRRLFQRLGLKCKGGEEAQVAQEFLNKLMELARAAGGEPPLPASPEVTEIEDLQRLVGNEQLAALRDRAADLESKIQTWSALKARAEQRRPVWDLVQGLAKHAGPLPEAKPILEQLDAIRDQRMLLDESDPVAPLRVSLAQCLRQAVNKAHNELEGKYQQALASLDASDVWKSLPQSDQTAILQSVGLVAPAKPQVSTDEALLAHLEARPLRSVRTEIDAIPGRLQQAIEQAARRLEPQVQTVALERATLRTEQEVNAWIERTKTKLIQAVKNGPILLK